MRPVPPPPPPPPRQRTPRPGSRRRPGPTEATPIGSFYNFNGDLISDLDSVVKPTGWNVRDFSHWEKMFVPRRGQIEAAAPPPLPRRRMPKSRPRPPPPTPVTFDRLLEVKKDDRLAFDRLISQVDRFDHGDIYELLPTLESRRGYHREDDRSSVQQNSITQPQPRQPRDFIEARITTEASSFGTSGEEEGPLPTFDVSFEDWLAESGVSTTPSSPGKFSSIPRRKRKSWISPTRSKKWRFYKRKKRLLEAEHDNANEKDTNDNGSDNKNSVLLKRVVALKNLDIEKFKAATKNSSETTTHFPIEGGEKVQLNSSMFKVVNDMIQVLLGGL